MLSKDNFEFFMSKWELFKFIRPKYYSWYWDENWWFGIEHT